MRPNGGSTALCLLLLLSVACGHDLKSNHVTQSFGFSEGETADAGEDAKAEDLTDSIQGLFSDAPDAKQPAPAKTQSKPSSSTQKKPQVAVAKVVKEVPKVAKEATQKSVKPSAPKPAVEVAKVVEKKAQVVKVEHAAKPVKAAPSKATSAAKTVAEAPKLKVGMLAKKGSQAKVSTAVAKGTKAKVAAATAKAKKASHPIVAAKPPQAKHPALAKKVKKVKLLTKAPEVKLPTTAVKAKHTKAKHPTKAGKASPTKVPAKAGKAVKAKHAASPVKAIKSKHSAKLKKSAAVNKPVQKAAKVAPTKKGPVTVAPAVKPQAHAHVTAVAAKAPKAPQPKISVPIAKVQVAEKLGQSNVGVPVTKLQVAKVASAKIVSKAVTKGKSMKAAHLKIPSVFSSSNGTRSKENTTKAIEAVVSSLPMASFALGDAKPAKNATKTKPKFPGNATQKAAWESREKMLEDEVKTLKARLAASSQVLDANKRVVPAPKVVPPKATGTFSAHPQDAQAAKDHKVEGEAKDKKASTKFMASTKPPPMQPLRKDEKPKVDVPTMNIVAAPNTELKPVALHHVANAGTPPQKEEDDSKKVTMGSTFTATPAKKQESALAVDATVHHETTNQGSSATDVANADSTGSTASSSLESTASSSSIWSWFSSFFTWLFGGSTSAASASPPAAPVAPHKASLIAVKQKNLKQDMLKTAQATKEESEHVIQVNDAWSQMEQEDTVEQDEVRREDAAERERAETAERPHQPTKDELQGRHGADMSNFWGSLEKEDYGIEHSVDAEDMDEYTRLTTEQNAQVVKAAESVKNTGLTAGRDHPLKHNDDKRLTIHEPWMKREKLDIAAEKKIHDSPDLQMLQLQHHHRRK